MSPQQAQAQAILQQAQVTFTTLSHVTTVSNTGLLKCSFYACNMKTNVPFEL